MRASPATLAHWGLFGACLLGAAYLGFDVWLRLRTALVAGEPTRQVLGDVLGLIFAALVLVAAAGWAFATRPPTPRKEPVDPRFA